MTTLPVYLQTWRLKLSHTKTVKLDRSLAFRHHLWHCAKTIFMHHTALATCRFRLGWWFQTLRTAALYLVYSTAEYYIPVWCRSVHTHLINSVLSGALRKVTGCQRPNPTDYLHILSGIHPAELCQLGATLSLDYRESLDPDYVHDLSSGSSDTSKRNYDLDDPFCQLRGIY